MIGQAFLSVQTGQALFKSKEGVFALNARKQSTNVCLKQDIDFFFDNETEIDILENVTAEQVFGKLKNQKRCFDALNATIAGFDPILSLNTRKMAIQQAESLLEDNDTYNFVQNRLFGNRVPTEADLLQALQISQTIGFRKTLYLYQCLAEKGNVIRDLQFFFSQTILNFELNQELPVIKDAFVIEGVFSRFFEATIKKDKKILDKVVFDFSFHAKLNNLIPQLSKFLNDLKIEVLSNYFEETETNSSHKNNVSDDFERDFDIAELLHSFIGQDTYRKKDKAKKTKKRSYKADFQGKLTSNIDVIIDFAQQNDTYNVHKRAFQLLEYNCKNSRQVDVIKTLTNLSQRFFDINELNLAEEFVGYISILEIQNDAFPYTLRSNILLKKGEYDLAERLINQTIKDYPDNIIARNVNAEILKAKGLYDEAEKWNDKTIQMFPNEIVPRIVKAEILKTKGLYNESERWNDETIQMFPNEAIPRTVKAEILKTKGLYDEAEKWNNKTIQMFSNDVVPRTVKTEILKAKGLYDEAEEWNDETIQMFPNDIIPRTVKAEILKVQGKYDEALSCYDETNNLFPKNTYIPIARLPILLLQGKLQLTDFREWEEKPVLKDGDDRVEYHILGMFYLKKGNFKNALAVFEHGYSQVKDIESISHYLSAISVTKIRLNQTNEIKTLYEANEVNKKIAIMPFSQMLMAHVAIVNSQSEEAKNILENLFPQQPHLKELQKLLFDYANNNTTILNRIYEEENYLLLAA
jgi:tetratricopeptide (TPR) repeat protein